MSRGPWNANIHYDALLEGIVPPGAARALDVGCGDGFLSARLAGRLGPGGHVVGLDADAGVLGRARERFPDAGVEWVHADVMTAALEPGSFDAVVSNAALHHVPDTAAALTRLAALVRPGGVVAVVGFARTDLRELPASLVGQACLLVLNVLRRTWEHTAPICWPPPHSYRETRRIAQAALPGCVFRRLLLGRYALTWTRPGSAGEQEPAVGERVEDRAGPDVAGRRVEGDEDERAEQ